MNNSKLPISWLSNLIIRTKTLNPKSPNLHHTRFLHNFSNPIKFNPISPKPTFNFTQKRHFGLTEQEEDQLLRELYADVEKESHREREAKRKAGIVVNEAEEEEEDDYLGVGPLIEKIDAELAKPKIMLDKFKDISFLDEPSDSDSEYEEENDRDFMEQVKKGDMLFQKITRRSEELHSAFAKSRTLDEAFRLMAKIEKFEARHFHLLPEYRVLGELLNRYKDATGQEKFMLAQKLNRGLILVARKEDFNPDEATNYGLLQRRDKDDLQRRDKDDLQRRDKDDLQRRYKDDRLQLEDRIGVVIDDEEEEEFDDMKSRDDLLLEKVNAIDKQLEEKLATLDYTFGRKVKALEEEIRELAEQRNDLTEKKKQPLYRKGFDAKMIDVNRTTKVTKGGLISKYSAIIACGNYNGVVGYAKAKASTARLAIQKAHVKCFQNLHYIERHEDHTIAHTIVTKHKRTKVYLWPRKTGTGTTACPPVDTILKLAGFKNVSTKVIGSTNPINTVRAVFQALNAIETPKDVQEKFGRSVVEKNLL